MSGTPAECCAVATTVSGASSNTECPPSCPLTASRRSIPLCPSLSSPNWRVPPPILLAHVTTHGSCSRCVGVPFPERFLTRFSLPFHPLLPLTLIALQVTFTLSTSWHHFWPPALTLLCFVFCSFFSFSPLRALFFGGDVGDGGFRTHVSTQFMSHTPWLALLILSTTIMDVCGEVSVWVGVGPMTWAHVMGGGAKEIPQRAAGFQSLARTLRRWESEPDKLKEAERLVKVGML